MTASGGGGLAAGLRAFFSGIGRYFRDFGRAVYRGDIFVKLSLFIMGAGYIRRGKIVHGVFVTALEGVFLWFLKIFALPNLAKFGTLGTVKAEKYFDMATFTNIWNDYDHSFKILLYCVISLVVIGAFAVIWMGNVREAYRLQRMTEDGKRIPRLRDDLRSAMDSGFHRTLLTLPTIGILTFTIVPLIVMIAVAFTNYDQQHMPPENLFTWVGLANFKTLFTTSMTITFGYSFWRILGWTLFWAFTATFTCYIGGILLALLINNRRTRGKKFWRTCFIIAMAVPQFVSLLLVRSFFADQGIVNTIFARVVDVSAGLQSVASLFGGTLPAWMEGWQFSLTGILKALHLVPEYLTYVPFLTNPNWARFMIIMINIWVGVPYLLLIATGVLMNIPADLYEAATIDGANAWQQFRKITMPYMLFVTGPYLINSVVQNINNFNVIYLLTKNVYETTDQFMANSHAQETDLLINWLFRLTNEYYNYKMASVIGIVVFIVCSIITLVAFNFVIKGNKEEAMQG